MINKTGSQKYQSFFAISNDKELGKLKMVYSSKIQTGINQAVLLESHSKDYTSYDPGYIDVNGNFHSCPICVHYVQINKIVHHKIGRKNIEININIFSKDFSFFRDEVFKVFAGTHEIPRIVNDINIFIDRDYQLDCLEIKRVFPTRRYSAESVIPAISKLELCIYENSRYIPAKDNIFWEEIEVRNIIKGTYLSDLIIQGLKKQCWTLEITEYGVLMISQTSRWALPDYERRKLENASEIEDQTNLIKGRLLIELMSKYDENDQMCRFMMIV